MNKLQSILPNPGHMSVRAWQSFFRSIYGERNEERFSGEYGLSRMWLHLVQDMSTLANAIRKNDVSLMLRMLPRLFCWLCGFCTKLNLDLEDTAWHFFPSICPTCWNAICKCGANKQLLPTCAQKDEASLNKAMVDNRTARPETIDGFVTMFARIYGNHSESANLTDVYLHFSEEVGEVAEWIRVAESITNPKAAVERELASELADVFSWMCKLCWRVNLNLQGFGPWAERQFSGQIERRQFEILFSTITAFEYKHGCPGCGQPICLTRCLGWERQITRLRAT